MTNIEKLKKAFVDGLGVKEDQVEGLKYMGITEWDSVGHMTLMSAIEEAFGIMMDTDDILEFNSFEKGKEILSTTYDIEF